MNESAHCIIEKKKVDFMDYESNEIDTIYLNFPISLLPGLFVDSRTQLDNIVSYCEYIEAQKPEYLGLSQADKMERAGYKFGINYNASLAKHYSIGLEIARGISKGTPFTGMDTRKFWDFYRNGKTDFEKLCLMAYCAIKSIIGKNRGMCLTNNNHILVRMLGFKSAIDFDSSSLDKSLADLFDEYTRTRESLRYRMGKILKELELSWHLKRVSTLGVRGFYVSFSRNVDLESMYKKSLSSTKKSKIKKLNDKKHDAKQRALDQLNNPSN